MTREVPRASRYDRFVKAIVTPLRIRGTRRADGYGTAAPRPVTGQLGMHTMSGAGGHYTAATVKGSEPKSPELLPVLYEPVLVTISANGFLLRGFESVDGSSFVQEWHCELAG